MPRQCWVDQLVKRETKKNSAQLPTFSMPPVSYFPGLHLPVKSRKVCNMRLDLLLKIMADTGIQESVLSMSLEGKPMPYLYSTEFLKLTDLLQK
jgi:hypothetical protein